MAKTKVMIKVNANVEELYLVGSFNDWDVKKADKLTKCAECGAFVANKMVEAGSTVEFKVLTAKDWANVEKGANGEEVQNHSFVAAKGLTVEVTVNNFAN